jgi:hypothetical protein
VSARYLPELTIRCRVCGEPITVRNRFETGKGVVSEPLECPNCGALIKNAPPIDEGMAKSLVLLASGAKAEKKEYGTLERFLDRYTLGKTDVDRLLTIAQGLEQSDKVAAKIREAADAVKAAYRTERERCLEAASKRKR